MGSLSGLERLSLSNNQLTGEIPSELWNLTNATLDLGGNQDSWCKPETQRDRYVGLVDCASRRETATATPTSAPRSQPTSTPMPAPTLDLVAIEADRQALVALYNATDGPNWTNNENWLSDAPLGHWHGVIVDSSGRVIEIYLRENGLRGAIPPEVGDLTHLMKLTLPINELSGGIPSELGGLVNLQTLILGKNQLSGDVPEELGRLTNLLHLFLDGNRLTGCVPSNLQNSLILENSNLGGLPFC